MSDATNIPCPSCGSPAGDVCRTKGGKRRTTCPERERKAGTADTASVHVAGLLDGFNTPPESVPAPVLVPAVPAPVVAPKADDFDEAPPPPKGRPKGRPIDREVSLPPGEETVGIFHQWDREGRIPAGAVLCEHIPLSGTGSKCRLVATSGPNPFSVKPGKEIPSGEAESWRILANVFRGQLRSQVWVILVPKTGASQLLPVG